MIPRPSPSRPSVRRSLGTAVIVALVLAGCGGTTKKTGGADAGSVGDADAGSTGDVGPGLDADAAGDGGRAPLGIGTLRLNQRPSTDAQDAHYSASARFYLGTERPTDACRTSTEGACRLQVCEGHLDQQMEYVSAGTISVFGGAQSVELEPGKNGTYNASGGGVVWSAKTTLSIRAGGAEAPRFLTELRPDVETRLTRPWLPEPGEPLRVDPTKALPVEWTDEALNSGEFGVVLSTKSGGRETTIECYWEAERGSGSVPGSLLEQLERVPGHYEFTVGARTSFEERGWEISVEAWQPVDDGSQMTASGIGKLGFR